ncbi:hypothetical protein [Qipengyuania sp. MTN3-11]|uniref:hypothetical protein n=1 Tax=Qipengyuania sp. MTN3-11 TaxID=3056557 RepID=UPI0036F43B05
MSWDRTLARTAVLMLASAGIALAAPAVAGVVVKSSGPSAGQYPVGKKLDDASSITLRAGDSVTVLTDGGTRVISGAGTHRVGAGGASKRSTFAVLTRQRSGARVRTGAVRSGTSAVAASNPNLWNLDVSQGGRMCVVDTGAINMWRADTTEEATYMFGRSGSDFNVPVTFSAGVSQASLDGDKLPVADGQAFTLTGPDGGTGSTVEFVVLDEAPADVEGMAAALASNGCQSQLDLLADRMMMVE